MRSRLLLALVAVLGLLSASPAAAAPATGETVVSFTFDGTFKGQQKAARILGQHRFAGTFYINSGYLGFPAYLSLEQLRMVSRERSEIGGASLFGMDLSKVSAARAKKEVCDDRATLAQLGYQVTSFSYPHSASPAQVKSVVQQCGYNSARETAGLYESPEACSSCPKAETLPPRDDFRIRTAALGSDLQELKSRVRAAESSGGGWVPLVFDRVCVCPDTPDAVSPAEFTRFVEWMTERPASTKVKTVDQVMGGELQPVTGTPLKRLVPRPSEAIGTSEEPSTSPGWTVLGFKLGRLDLLLLAAVVIVAVLLTVRLARRQAPPASPGPPAGSPSRDGSQDPTSVPHRRRLLLFTAAAVVLVAVGAAAVTLLLRSDPEAPEPRSAGSTESDRRVGEDPPPQAPAVGSYVESRVTASGDVRVTQWIRSEEPVTGLRLRLPSLSGGLGDVGARDLVVAADRVPVDVPATVGAGGHRVRFEEPATAVYVRYTLQGVVERSESAPGRALVRATALRVGYTPRSGPSRVALVGSEVLSMSCAATRSSAPEPCGSPGNGGWEVLLRGPERGDAVMAQVNLG